MDTDYVAITTIKCDRCGIKCRIEGGAHALLTSLTCGTCRAILEHDQQQQGREYESNASQGRE